MAGVNLREERREAVITQRPYPILFEESEYAEDHTNPHIHTGPVTCIEKDGYRLLQSEEGQSLYEVGNEEVDLIEDDSVQHIRDELHSILSEW